MTGELAYLPARPHPSSDQSCQQNWPDSSTLGWFRFAGAQETRAFGPIEHVKALHPQNRSGGSHRSQVVFTRRITDGEEKWKQFAVNMAEAPQFAKAVIDRGEGTNFYFSMNAFRARRRIEDLASIGSVFADIDYREIPRWASASPDVVLVAILTTLTDEKMPPPSLVLDTGRGLCVVWLHEQLPPAALQRWNRVQDRVCDVLAEYGADRRAKDAARVFRVAGSTHSGADTERRYVRLLWIQGQYCSPYRFAFDDLANEMLPTCRAAVVGLRAERARRRASGTGTAPSNGNRRDSVSYGEAILEDLERLRLYRYPTGILPAGTRDAWLFCASVALAWTCHPDALESEILQTAEVATGWSAREVRRQMGAVIRRAYDAAAGRRIQFAGQEVDPRYRMKASTIVRWLSISPEEQREAQLRLLLDDSVRRERKALRERERRQRSGALSRTDARTKRLNVGQCAIYRMAKEGITRDELAVELGVSAGYVSKAIREARAASG